MKKKIRRSLLGLALCAAVLIYAALSLQAVGSDLQYLVPAPALEIASQGQGEQEPPKKPNQAALSLAESLQNVAGGWKGVMKTWTLSGIIEKASLAADTGGTKQARLTALWENAFLITPQYLHFGRLFYPEELRKGAAVILLDEQLALELFKIAQPIGRIVTVSGVDFTVTGILRHSKRVGDGEDYGAYVPLAYLWDKEVQLQALQVTARPVPGSGARSTFAAAMENWRSGGTLADLGKEAMAALLPLRVLLFYFGAAAFLLALAVVNGRFRWFFGDYRQRLDLEYAVQLMPRLLLGLLSLAAGYGLLALAAAFLIRFLTAPVYTFTEWVPAVLVEWVDIQKAFWQVWQSAGRLQEWRSPELNRIRFFGMLTAWFSAGAAMLVTGLWARWRAGRRGKAYEKEVPR